MKYLDMFESYSFDGGELFSKLLSFGGDSVNKVYEEDLDNLINYGVLYDTSTEYELVKMEPSNCHKNVVTFYSNFIKDSNNSYDELSIVTGWALSSDGIWYQHSWLYFNYDDVIIETTEPRLLYYGTILKYTDLDNFIDNN